MPWKRARTTELSVEREVTDRAGMARRIRLTAEFESEGGAPPTPAELGRALRALDEELDKGRAEAGFRGPPARAERTLEELMEAYRPRQPELVELLRSEGEISEAEAELLRAALGPMPAVELPPAGGSLAAMPLSTERPTSGGARSVEELLRVYQIGSLKQAGLVRARRQISFDEYMSLKRHYGAEERPPATPP